MYGEPRDTAAEVWRRIRERAVPEVTRRDSIPEVYQRPVNVCAIERHGVATNLTSVFQHILRARGYEIDAQGRSTYRALHANELLWFAGCLTTADVSRSQRTILKQEGALGAFASPRSLAGSGAARDGRGSIEVIYQGAQ